MALSGKCRASWSITRGRVRLFVSIPLEVFRGRQTEAATANSASAGTANGGRHDSNESRERLASTEASKSVDSAAAALVVAALRPDDPSKYQLEHEPIPDGDPVDFRFQFELMRDRVEREEDRGKSLDGKIATIIAGIVASIGFTLRVNSSAVGYGSAVLYLVPLVILFSAFRTRALFEAPTAESILKFFQAYPVSTLREGAVAMMTAIKENRRLNDKKANYFDLGILLTIVVTLIVLVIQIALAIHKGEFVAAS